MEHSDAILLVDQVNDLVDVNDFMQDEQFTMALAYAIKCMLSPEEINHSNAHRLIIRLQAYALKFALLGTTYATVSKGAAGTTNNHKKNIYKTTSVALDRLVDALKYVVRNG